jgi:hypothetical protein
VDIGKAITFIFEDPDWLKKVAIGIGLILLGLIFMIVLIGFVPLLIVTGYTVLLIRNVMNGVEHPLPEWEDWGELFILGLKLVIVQFIWALPLIILSTGSSIPAALTENSSNAQGFLIALSAVCGCLSFIVGILYSLVEPVVTFLFARDGEFAAAFDFGRVFRLVRDNIVNLIVAMIISAVAGFALVLVGLFVGTLALVIGLIVTFPAAVLLSELVKAHLYGQVGREADAKSIEAI